MRVLVEVVEQPLNLRGPLYHVGERLFLDSENELHAIVLDHDHATEAERPWVRRLVLDAAPAAAAATVPVVAPDEELASYDQPPVDRMVKRARQK